MQGGERLRVESGADFGGEKEFLFVVVSDQDRTEMLPRSLGRREPTDHKFLLVHALEFDPGAAAPPGLINRIAQFADQSLETAPLDLVQKRLRVSTDLARKADGIAYTVAELSEQ